MNTRNYLTNQEIIDFYKYAIANRGEMVKRPLGKLIDAVPISYAVGYKVDIDEVVLQSTYLVHIQDYHAADGIRKDKIPFVADDLLLAVQIINTDISPEYRGLKTHTGNPLLKFQQTINGVTYKVIGEIREGRKNRNVAIYNMYKR